MLNWGNIDGQGFAEYMKKMQGEKPDLVSIRGYFVDDDTSKEEMISVCKALGNLNML